MQQQSVAGAALVPASPHVRPVVTEMTTNPATVAASSACTNLTSAATSCSLRCIHGLMKDSSNCDRCQCNPPPCPVLDCRDLAADCISGGGFLTTDSQGCPTCQCQGHGNGGINASSACFTSGGHSYSNGESWFDGCRQCYCHNGRERCALLYCPVLSCSQPTLRPGDCCPTCSTEAASAAAVFDVGFPSICSTFNDTGRRGQAAGDGVWWLDACTSCLCHRGQALCESRQCAPALCEQPLQQPGACCPSCPEPGARPTAAAPAAAAAAAPPTTSGQGSHADALYLQGCSSSMRSESLRVAAAQTYQHGEVWRVSTCQVCTCQHGLLRCYSQSCSPTAVTCRGSVTILRKGQCCPECAADSWSCIINGSQVVPHGFTWNDGCRTCSCRLGSFTCELGPCDDDQHACRSGQAVCCEHCSGNSPGERSHVMSPLTAGLLALLAVFGAVIVILVVIVVRRTRHRGNTLTAIPKILEMRAFNNCNTASLPTDIACKPLMEKRPKSTNLEFLSISSPIVPPNRDGECFKPLVDGLRNEYVHC